MFFAFFKRMQISNLKDEVARVRAEALHKDEEHEAAQASALAAEKALRYKYYCTGYIIDMLFCCLHGRYCCSYRRKVGGS